MTSFEMDPIGIFRSNAAQKHEVPRQGALSPHLTGWVALHPHPQLAAMVEDLEGFSHLWLVSWFDQVSGWHAKVRPPRGGGRRGVLGTRSPHRPNPVGLTLVELDRIELPSIWIRGHDLLDGTPILDIKPYIEYADRPVTPVRQGWLETLETTSEYSVTWSALAEEQRAWLVENGVDLLPAVTAALVWRPYPYRSHRVRPLGPRVRPVGPRVRPLNGNEESLGMWRGEYAHRTWRVEFWRDDASLRVTVTRVYSGYDEDTLAGRRESRWDDVPLHRTYQERFERG